MAVSQIVIAQHKSECVVVSILANRILVHFIKELTLPRKGVNKNKQKNVDIAPAIQKKPSKVYKVL